MAALLSPDASNRIAILRAKINSGTYTQEDCREAVELLRQGRGAAAATSAKSKAAKAPVDSDKLLDELGGL